MVEYWDWPFATSLSTTVAVLLLATLSADRVYQRYSHKWTKEPPMLPYSIPVVGHALWYGSDVFGLLRCARENFPGDRPFSLLLFGKRVYVFTHNRDVSIVFRKSKELPFLPLIESYSGLAWGISEDGMKILSKVDDEGDSLFRNAHAFYRDALKPGPQLDTVTLKFLKYLDEALDAFDKDPAAGVPTTLLEWSRIMLGLASTNAMMGPSLLKHHAKTPLQFLNAALLVESAFFYFVNRIPRLFARKHYDAREAVLDSLESYFRDSDAVAESALMIKDREVQLREQGLSDRDIAAYTFSAYISLIANAKIITYNMLRHIFTQPDELALLRAELAPVFNESNKISTLEQVKCLTDSCPRLRAFYHETLRLYSRAPSNRVVVEDTMINSYVLRKGHNVICPSYTQHHSTEYFCQDPHPDVFDPSRFLRPKGERAANPAMIRAFGGGVSLCSGRHFAGNEVLSLVASVIWRNDMEFVNVETGKVRISKRSKL